ncbi:MAG: hypothetical protein JWN79_1881 [Gemmatimonadetes bacterium]|jgi:hypothetical protein|nr:hypothetical protein [Gemmatimonadota bacterium]
MRFARGFVLALGIILPGVAGAQAPTAPARPNDLSRDLERLARGEQVAGLPPADSVSPGARTIPAGAVVHGTVVAHGPVDVRGTVDGTVVSLSGDVTVHRGGTVTGDALAVGGRVIADSGRVDGEMRSMSALPALLTAAPVAAPRTAAEVLLNDVRMVAGSFAVLLVVALGVLLFAGHNLDEVVGALERQFGRAFWFGVLGQLLILPVLVVLLVALAVSVIGILLIPFAIVAYAIAVAGLVTLGFLAVARLVGGALWQRDRSTDRAQSIGALGAGIAVFFALWMVAALLGWAPLAASVVRAAALAASWAAVTLGLGSAILSRAGTHRRVASGQRPVELAAWQTPTPITGVIAARRPVTAAREAQ